MDRFAAGVVILALGMGVVGGCQTAREWDPMNTTIAPDPVPQHPENGPFLFSYFLGNGDGLHLAWSDDGLNFTPLGGPGKIFLKPVVGENIDGSTKDQHLMRDPCLRQGPDGMYHVVWTTGWYQRGIGVASSPDLVHWSRQQFVEVMNVEGWGAGAVNSWAPELFYDDASGEWLIFWASTIPKMFTETVPRGPALAQADKGGPKNDVPLNHRIFYVTTRDFAIYSKTRLLYDQGFNCIDATMVRLPAGAGDGGKYLMVLKDETKAPVAVKALGFATADTPEGRWSKAEGPISPAGIWVEGPSIARVKDAWYVYFDKYVKPQSYGAMKTTDFKQWEEVKQNLSFPNGARHGTVFPVTPEVLDRLKKER